MRKYISFLIKPSSSLCNMRCRYCFYYDVACHREVSSFGMMDKNVRLSLIKKALSMGEDFDITFHFQGGEPTLVGLDFFKSFVNEVEQNKTKQMIHYAIQTNGTLLDQNWVDFFYDNHFLVGISLDGYSELHNYFRKDHQYGSTHNKVMNSIELLRKKGVDFNILTVLTNKLSKNPEQLYSFYKKNNLNYIQLIPCIAGLDEKYNKYSLSPKNFYTFYKSFFELWKKDFYKGHYMSVGLFDSVIALFKNGVSHQCGVLGKCMPQFVVESNGDVFPCDFYVVDKYRCGNIVEDDLIDIAKSNILSSFLKEPRRSCKVCDTCRFVEICHKNCKRLNIAYYNNHYCGYREFLEYTWRDFLFIAKNCD